MDGLTPLCPYCLTFSEKVTGATIYPHRRDLAHKVVYRCAPCGAWVHCHPDTEKPLGRLANAELRLAKQQAHAAFDPLWQAKMRRDGCSKTQARKAGYKWLAEKTGIAPADCHIGMMDPEQCRSVVRVCNGAVRQGGAA